jgi:hypothetical protein
MEDLSLPSTDEILERKKEREKKTRMKALREYEAVL